MPDSLRTRGTHTRDIVATVDPTGLVTSVSSAIQPTLGLAPAEVVGNVLWELVHPSDVVPVHTAIQDVFNSAASKTLEFQILGGSGRWHRLDAVVHLANGAATYEAIVRATDVTDRRRAETELREHDDQLRQARKMEVVGRLAGGISHDFGNLLTIIIGASTRMLDALPADSPLRTHAESVKSTAERAASMVRQLLSFSRPGSDTRQIIDLNDVVAEAKQLLERLLGEHIRLETIPSEYPWKVEADRTQIEQVLLNLAVNARDAMPGGGTLTIETRNLDADRLSKYGVDRRAASVVVSVADTGIGMDAATQSRAFEPFFTTKPIGEGTGIGLATVQGIVSSSGGWVHLASTVGQGTTVTFGLPRAEREASQIVAANRAEPTVRPAAASGGSETILLVEDEPGVRELVRDMLTMAGYRVLEAATPSGAVDISEAFADPIDLLFTDVVMPESSGLELSTRLRSVRPRLRVMYMSGFPEPTVGDGAAHAPGTHFIAKPFDRQGLLRAVRRALDD